MRVILLVAMLGCGAGSHGPAWPKPSDKGSDGGESLAPHEARAVAAVEASPDEKPSAGPVEKPSKAASPGVPITPVVAPPVAAPTSPEEPVTTEDIVIEIDGNE